MARFSVFFSQVGIRASHGLGLLMQLHQDQRKDLELTLNIQAVVIEVVERCRCLGVHLNNKLDWTGCMGVLCGSLPVCISV